MREVTSAEWKARFSLDDDGRVRQITHFEAPWEASRASPLAAAIEYLRRTSGVLSLAAAELRDLDREVSFLDPVEQGVSYRLGERKRFFDSTTILFQQTYLNVPVWRAGIALTIRHDPPRVVSVTATHGRGMDARLPLPATIAEYRRLFALAKTDPPQTAAFIRWILGRNAAGAPGDKARMIRGRFFVYRYDGREEPPALPLPAVDPGIRPGRWYLVSEVTFSLTTPHFGALNWRALVDVETGSVLLLQPLVGYLQAMVFQYDPITGTGDASNTPDQGNSVLDPLRSAVDLPNLEAAVDGVQHLRGRFAVVADVNQPWIAPPTEPADTAFAYSARTNDFAAVNAYYHTDRFFTLVEDLGFPIADYFRCTTFPVPVDHRDDAGTLDGEVIAARCAGNGEDGIQYVAYALNDLSDTANPLGRACDSRVHLHELGGHGILFEHVADANFNFAHSAGDSLSAICHDPDSRAPDRFLYAPWLPQADQASRRFDRSVAEGWAWGGSQDKKNVGYTSEEILATTLFRVYRSIGGDAADPDRRRFASRMMMYLILRAVSTLTPDTNPGDALGFANALMTADLLDWTTEGVHGGAYGKVIRWSFEQQGLYQPAGASGKVVQAGAPPEVDVYIDDGRGGEYPYQEVYWDSQSIWNEPAAGAANHAYVRIRNRGTEAARNVRVRGYSRKPGGGTAWPDDFQPLATPQLCAGTLAAGNAEEKVVGPFEWFPSGKGQDGLLMIVSADGDASNADRFGAGASVPEWRLVPNDNNVGLRNLGDGSRAVRV